MTCLSLTCTYQRRASTPSEQASAAIRTCAIDLPVRACCQPNASVFPTFCFRRRPSLVRNVHEFALIATHIRSSFRTYSNPTRLQVSHPWRSSLGDLVSDPRASEVRESIRNGMQPKNQNGTAGGGSAKAGSRRFAGGKWEGRFVLVAVCWTILGLA